EVDFVRPAFVVPGERGAAGRAKAAHRMLAGAEPSRCAGGPVQAGRLDAEPRQRRRTRGLAAIRAVAQRAVEWLAVRLVAHRPAEASTLQAHLILPYCIVFDFTREMTLTSGNF